MIYAQNISYRRCTTSYTIRGTHVELPDTTDNIATDNKSIILTRVAKDILSKDSDLINFINNVEDNVTVDRFGDLPSMVQNLIDDQCGKWPEWLLNKPKLNVNTKAMLNQIIRPHLENTHFQIYINIFTVLYHELCTPSLFYTNLCNNGSIPNIFDEKLHEYYLKNSWTHEFYGENGIKLHTQAVTGNFNLYFNFPKINEVTGFSREEIINLLALHDIGKGLDQRNFMQHCNTKSVIKQNYKEIGLSAEEANTISAVVSQNPIGSLFMAKEEDKEAAIHRSRLILMDSYTRILKYKPNLTKTQYFNLIKIFYSCDAAAYFTFYKSIFDEQLQFKLKFASQLDSLFKSFTTMDNPNHSIRRTHYYNNLATLERDMTCWLGKYSSKLGNKPVALIFDKIELPKSILDTLAQQGIEIKYLESENNMCNNSDSNIVCGFSKSIKQIALPSNESPALKYKNFVLVK